MTDHISSIPDRTSTIELESLIAHIHIKETKALELEADPDYGYSDERVLNYCRSNVDFMAKVEGIAVDLEDQIKNREDEIQLDVSTINCHGFALEPLIRLLEIEIERKFKCKYTHVRTAQEYTLRYFDEV